MRGGAAEDGLSAELALMKDLLRHSASRRRSSSSSSGAVSERCKGARLARAGPPPNMAHGSPLLPDSHTSSATGAAPHSRPLLQRPTARGPGWPRGGMAGARAGERSVRAAPSRTLWFMSARPLTNTFHAAH